MTARMSASALQRIAPLSSDMTAPNQPVDTAAQSPASEVSESSSDTSTGPAAGIEPSAVAEAAAYDEPAPHNLEAESPSVSFAAPSVAATIAPPSAVAPVPVEPVARFIPANASVETPKQVDRDVLEVMAPQRISAGTDAMEVMRVSAEADPAITQSTTIAGTSFSISSIDDHDRSIEDTVAELLRPMLKTWLAENMPRIVERALRRELTEQLLIDKQAAAE
jgi:cell pole-organizing protein PopZ